MAKAKRDEENLRVRRRAMGNMQFVGHLYKAAMITEKIVHVCFQELLREPSSEEVECVCKLLTTAGPYLQVLRWCPPWIVIQSSVFVAVCCRHCAGVLPGLCLLFTPE